jgi:hypothetical protein
MTIKCYVSSTFKDLERHRAAVNEAILKLGHVDIAMEHYVAGPERPIARCINDVRRCDLYIGLFGRRYGYIPPGSDLSITEQEYRTAVRTHKDILCFLLKGDVEWPSDFVDDGELATKLAALREEIGKKYLSGFFGSDPYELAALVSASITKALDLDSTPMDFKREQRLMTTWKQGKNRVERTKARHALFNMGSPRYAAAIRELVVESEDVTEIAMYMDELLRLGVNSWQAMSVFVELLHDDSDSRRLFAVFQIGELGLRGKDIHPRIVNALLALEDDASPAVRSELAHTLGKITHFEEMVPAVKETLERLASDPHKGPRTRAKESQKILGFCSDE